MMVDWGWPPVPLDWDAEGSVALVVMPQDVEDSGLLSFAIACEPYPPWYDETYTAPDNIRRTIVNTLNRNLAERIESGEITEAEIAVIADMLFEAFDGGLWLRTNEVTHVAKGGAERLTNVFFDWNRDLDTPYPPQGAMAQAGPDGDVLVLGEFWFRVLGNMESYCNESGTWVLTDNPLSIDSKAQLVIGWFTR